jgi:RNA polymerase sigma-70 factor (ECF subfamily)
MNHASSRGEAHGFRTAVETLVAPAWRVLRRCGVPAEDADDGMQRVLVQLSRHWSRLALLPADELRSYACCVAAGVAKSMAREDARRRARVAASSVEDIDPGPHDALERKQSVQMVDRILASMDEERRTVFVLYEIEGLTGPQIAAHLEIPLGTVASRLRTAREDFERAVTRLRATEQTAKGMA